MFYIWLCNEWHELSYCIITVWIYGWEMMCCLHTKTYMFTFGNTYIDSIAVIYYASGFLSLLETWYITQRYLQVCSVMWQHEEYHWSHRVCVEGTHWQSWGASSSSFSSCFYQFTFSLSWEIRADCAGHWEFLAAQPNVIFSECLVLCVCLLLLGDYPKYIGRFHVRG